MKIIEIQGEVVGEIVVSTRRQAGNVVESQKWITGTTLRGALAGWWRRNYLKSQDESEFRNLFLGGGISFGPLFPVAEPEKQGGTGYLTTPIPLSARQCKTNPGFIDEKNIGIHGVYDILISGNYEKKCEHSLPDNKKCENSLEKSGDSLYYTIQAGRGYYQKSHSPKTRMAQHVGIDNWKNVAKKGILYSLFSISRGEVFRGYLWGEESTLYRFHQYLSNLDKLFIGKGASRNGYLRITVNQIPDASDDTFYPKFDEFHKGNGGVTVTLVTPAIIQDRFLRYKTVLHPSDIGLNKPGSEEFDHIFSRAGLIGGWQAVHKLPKVKEVAIEQGSCFYKSDKSLSDINPPFKLFGNWGQVGQRKTEGFGLFRINDSFHFKTGVL